VLGGRELGKGVCISVSITAQITFFSSLGAFRLPYNTQSDNYRIRELSLYVPQRWACAILVRNSAILRTTKTTA
jgi:hypothetical protein